MTDSDNRSRPLQRFSDEYLERCRELSPADIVRYLDDFKRIHHPMSPSAHAGTKKVSSRLISLKVPEPLLAAFKTKARLSAVPYQTQIKNLMRQWLAEAHPHSRDAPRQ